MKSNLDKNERKMLDINPNKGVKSQALGKKTGTKDPITGKGLKGGSKRDRYIKMIQRIGRDAPHGEHSLN